MFVENQEILEKRYRIMKKLGSGAFGDIYKGMNPSPPARATSRSLTIFVVEKKKTGEFLAAKVVRSPYLQFY